MSSRLVAVGTLLLCACVDAEARSESTIDRPRIVAVIADPSESYPGGSVRFNAVVATPNGPLAPLLTWSFCSTPRAASDNTAAAPACVLNAERPVDQMGVSVDVLVPGDACMRFGSETPSGRTPNAADLSGGYYQALRIALAPDEVTLARYRIRCALPNAPLAAARDFNRDYVPNRRPAVAAVRAFGPEGEVALTSLPVAETLTFRVEAAADARESYLLYDPRSGALTTAAERLSVAWYITNGAFENPTVDVPTFTAENRWRATDPGSGAWLWVVLRDDRGAMTVEVRGLKRAPM